MFATARARAAAFLTPLALAACVAAPPAATPPPIAPPPALTSAIGLERVMGKDARTLTELFGTPDQDVREETARKLQFASSACVLDAYLYAKPGAREPVVTWVDARLPTGGDFDRASCVAALSRRPEAR